MNIDKCLSKQINKLADNVGRCFTKNWNSELAWCTSESADQHVEWIAGHHQLLASDAAAVFTRIATTPAVPPVSSTGLLVAATSHVGVVVATWTVANVAVADVDVADVADHARNYCQCDVVGRPWHSAHPVTCCWWCFLYHIYIYIYIYIRFSV